MATKTSRIVVKNLPKYLTEKRLREHFAQKGNLTDVKLMRTETEQDALTAVQYFNNTFIDTSPVQVELARPVGDAQLPRPWSKYSRGSSAHEQKLAADTSRSDKNDLKAAANRDDAELRRAAALADRERKQRFLADLYGSEADPQLKEYLAVMAPRSHKAVWQNEDEPVAGPRAKAPPKAQMNKNNSSLASVRASSKVSLVKSKKAGGDKVYLTKTHVTFDSGSEDENADVPEQKLHEDEDVDVTQKRAARTKLTAEATSTRKPSAVAFADGSSDDEAYQDWMTPKASGQVGGSDQTDEDDESDEDRDRLEKAASSSKPPTGAGVVLSREKMQTVASGGRQKKRPGKDYPSAPSVEEVAENGRLFVRNLPYTCSEEDLRKLFERYGPLSEVHIAIDKETKQSKGFAYVLFLIPEHAVKAMAALDAQIFQGRLLHVLPASMRPVDDQSAAAPAGRPQSTHKAAKERQQKANASSSFNWNSLFMSTNAVAESMSERLGVSKSELLDRDADSMAVRLALAETHVISETKDFFAQHGVVLDAFDQLSMGKVERSDTVILVKNIPANTTEPELRALFGKFGSLQRVVLPPSRTVALVEFLAPSEARSAFRHLAYAKFKHLPLYLEWAPTGTFDGPPKKPAAKGESDVARLKDTEPLSKAKALPGSVVQPMTGAPLAVPAGHRARSEIPGGSTSVTGTVVFVKNLAFETTEATVRATCELSLGYGFVEFARKADADKAIKLLQNTEVDGHAWQLKRSDRPSIAKPTENSADASNSTRQADQAAADDATKLLVRNVPFQANAKELRELFKSFGQLKMVRLPKKFDGSHRGFAFIEFVTHQEAENAYKALFNSHLYGRHLVLEWAKDDDSVEAVREKTVRQLKQQQESSSAQLKKRRLNSDNLLHAAGKDDSDDDRN